MRALLQFKNFYISMNLNSIGVLNFFTTRSGVMFSFFLITERAKNRKFSERKKFEKVVLVHKFEERRRKGVVVSFKPCFGSTEQESMCKNFR